MRVLALAAACVAAVLAHNVAFANVCPAVGVATDCNAIITVAPNGTSSLASGPASTTNYDGNDDALMGIINNSATTISSITLNGNGSDIFGFDGDGLTYFGVPGNPLDPSGYGGPNVFYSNISSDLTMGTVNFITPLAANGGSSYFALENSFDIAAPPTVGGGTAVTPEPSSLILLGSGAVGLAGAVRRKLRA